MRQNGSMKVGKSSNNNNNKESMIEVSQREEHKVQKNII